MTTSKTPPPLAPLPDETTGPVIPEAETEADVGRPSRCRAAGLPVRWLPDAG
ncbi:hypothetical protein [Streptomyces hyaluromycini]|uniref:hypothetical protein n=1 Tax=Streptomyces hyaluromycini TaxID=1377993 RepID=UPI00142E4051|nr:hypothetical protein [Streptomyces hyaluromycini]